MFTGSLQQMLVLAEHQRRQSLHHRQESEGESVDLGRESSQAPTLKAPLPSARPDLKSRWLVAVGRRFGWSKRHAHTI